MSQVGPFNEPRNTWRLASYERVERRQNGPDRRKDPQRTPERRAGLKRTLRSLLRF
ncbi:MAG: hypothetical protein RMK74_15220 [Myxococcales bacterium]|nr:hypothetical protein [Myxococcales bacterium]